MISFLIPFGHVGAQPDAHRQTAFDFVHQHLKEDWPDAEIKTGSVCRDGVFDRALTRNSLAEIATGDPLVFLDADSYVSKVQMQAGIENCGVRTHAAWGFGYDTYYCLSPLGTTELIAGTEKRPHYDYVFPGPDPNDRPAAVGGCVIVSRFAFEIVNGYDERFVGWGFEDRAFALALETMVGTYMRAVGPLYHLWHPEPEEERFGQPNLEHNRWLYTQYQNARGNPALMRALIQGR